MTRWLFEPVPRARIAVFRAIVYLFVAADLVIFTPWVRAHGSVDGELYQPLWIARLLHLPTPTSLLVQSIFWVLLAASLIAAAGKAPRLLGWTVFALYFEWMIIAMSYGKVDHDRFAFLVALAALPTCGRLGALPWRLRGVGGPPGEPLGGRLGALPWRLRGVGGPPGEPLGGVARWRDRTPDERAGWALRVVQVAVVATYFLAAWSKLRFGGLDWMTGSVLARAILRRGTEFAHLIAPVPGLLIAAQIGIMSFELMSPLIFVIPERWRKWAVAYFYSFHLVTIAIITISFAPHLVALLSFLPLERAADKVLRRRGEEHPPAGLALAAPGAAALTAMAGKEAGASLHRDAAPAHNPAPANEAASGHLPEAAS
jgi:HTTM domain